MNEARRSPPVPADLVVVWRVTEICSLGCKFCAFSRELKRSRRSANPHSVLTFLELLADVQQKFGWKIHVSWLGGEPLDWEWLPHVARVGVTDCELSLGATTNGLPLRRDEIRQCLLRYFEQLTVSIDGPNDHHDVVRSRKGLFDEIHDAVDQLRVEDRNNAVWRRVNTILMRQSIAHFPRFCSEMNDWGFHELTFNQLGGLDRPDFYPAHRLLPDQVTLFAEQLPDLCREMAQQGMRISGSDAYLQRIMATTIGRELPIQDCGPASQFLFINERGIISPCSFSSNSYGIPLEHVESADRFASLPRLFGDRKARLHLKACEDCHATHVFDKFAGALSIDLVELS